MSTPAFVGRTEELQVLKNAWFKAKARQPQIVNIIANTGVGKTRLVHAFYQWLSTEPSQGDGSAKTGYWPDDLGVGRQRVVNPPLECFAPFDLKHRAIPWLWWGMYWTDVAGEKEPAFNRFSHYLELHLELIEAEQNFKKNILHSTLELGFEEIVNASGEFIPGVGTAINIVKFAKKLYNSKKKQDDNLKGAAESNIKDANERIDNLMARLSVLLNPAKQDKLPLPMVLFLDDIQFSAEYHQDSSTILFLERLLRKALNDSWPLLVVTTHWKTEWNLHKSQQDNQGQSWYQLLQRVKSDVEIAAGAIQAIELTNIPTPGLRQMMLNSLPGLSQQNQATILQQIDNARWLSELLIALSDNQDNFIGHNRQQALSPYGEKRLSELLSSRDYLDVIRKRLEADAMKDVRVILGATAWHTNDLEFISSLTQAFSEPLARFDMISIKDGDVSKRIHSLLLQALDPGAYIEGSTRDGQLAELIRFPERGYLDVAKALFDKTRLPDLQKALGLLIIDWLQRSNDDVRIWQRLAHDEQKVFLQIAVKVLESLRPGLSSEQEVVLSAKEATLRELVADGTIDEETLAAKLKNNRQAMLDKSVLSTVPDAEFWKHVALVELAERYQHDGDGRAWDLALEIARFADVRDLSKKASCSAIMNLAENLFNSVSHWSIAADLLTELEQQFAPPLDKAVEEEKLSSYLQVNMYLSDLYEIQGNQQLRRTQLSKALDAIERSYSNTPVSDKISAKKPWLLIRLADLNKVFGNTNAARLGYKSCMLILNQHLTVHGEIYSGLDDLTIPILRLADLDKDEGNLEAARLNYLLCLDIYEKIITKFGELPELLSRFAGVLERLADLDNNDFKIDKARLSYQRSLVIRTRLIDNFGETPTRLYNLTIPIQRLADLDSSAEEYDVARAGYMKSLLIIEGILQSFGETPDRLRSLALILYRLADLDKDFGDIVQVRELYVRGNKIFESLLDNSTKSVQDLLDISASIERLADINYSNNHIDEAVAGYKRSLEIYERLLADFGKYPRLLRAITVPIERLAIFYKATKEIDTARALYIRSLDIQDRLLKEFDECPQHLQDLTISLLSLADLEKTAGNNEVARECYLRGLDILGRLLAEVGESSLRLKVLMGILGGIYELDVEAGNSNAAKDGYEKVLAIHERLQSYV
jgi:tetratricopeptide (TPR) repeat protein